MTKLRYLNNNVVFAIAILFYSQASFGFQAWWQCQSRKGGDWSFGRAPSICLVDHMQTQSAVKSQYGPLLFGDSKSRSSERNRYMTELNALAKDVARYYIKRRKPNVSESEIQAFTKGLLTLMHQETFWSHYRTSTDNKVRYMRGDSGHGHGVMQVDDRSHQTALLEGRGADLVKNMMYGLDVFYREWQRAPDQSCVSSATNYRNRTRSAWAAYNGGPRRICRWTSSTGTFAHHDVQFLTKFNQQSFNKHVLDQNKRTSLNVSCLAEGQRPCAPAGSGPVEEDQVQDGELYQIGAGLYCIANQGQFQCVGRFNDVACLELKYDRKFKVAGKLSSDAVDQKNIKNYDRNKVCGEHVSNLYEITQTIQTQRRINLRKTPAGELISTLPEDHKTTILDFAVTESDTQKRYYKVRYNNQEGYIYSGNEDTYETWVARIDEPQAPPSIVAQIGDTVEITGRYGINQRETPGGKQIQRVPRGQTVKVIDRIVRGSQNYLYYKVSYKGEEGYIYSGYLTDESSVSRWTVVINQKRMSEPVYQLASQKIYSYLRECPGNICSNSSHHIKSDNPNDSVRVLKEANNWVLVESLAGDKKGWILADDLEATQ